MRWLAAAACAALLSGVGRAEPAPQKRKHHHRRAPGVPPARPTRPAALEEDTVAPVAEPVAPVAEPVEETPPAVAPETPRRARFSLQGFVMARATVARQDTGAAFYGLVPSSGSPRAYLELDLQPQLSVLDRRFGAGADVTGYISSLDPKYLLLVNELFVDSKLVGPLYVLAGRKRVVWGSGLAVNPTDLINPVKNPLDFEQQRAGAWLFPLVEVVTKKVTVSALVNPRTTYDHHGLPTQLDFTKPLAAARLYALVLGADVNLMYFYDAKVRRHSAGLSLSRYFGDKLEAHVEALAQQGASGFPPLPIVDACAAVHPASEKAHGSVVGGGRLDLSDQTFLSLEYFFNGNGFDRRSYDAYRAGAACTRAALASVPTVEAPVDGHPIDPLFALLRQHYIAIAFVRPHVTAERLEKLSVSATILWDVYDASALLQARAAYKLYDAVTIGLMGSVFTGRHGSELASLPTRASGSFDLRATF